MFGAPELGNDVSNLIEDDDPHHLALHDNDHALLIDTDTARMLKDVGTKLTDELAILVVDLNL